MHHPPLALIAAAALCVGGAHALENCIGFKEYLKFVRPDSGEELTPASRCGPGVACVATRNITGLPSTLLRAADSAWLAGVDVTGAYCDVDGFCKLRKKEGETCIYNGLSSSPPAYECEPGYVCKGSTGSSKCVKLLKGGESCDPTNARNSDPMCSFGTECVSDKCVAQVYGAPCNSDTSCEDGLGDDARCINGTCADPTNNADKDKDGDECTSSSQCRSRLCRWVSETDCGDECKGALGDVDDDPPTGSVLVSSVGLSCEDTCGTNKAECVAQRSVSDGQYTHGPDSSEQPLMCKSGRTDTNGFCTNQTAIEGTSCVDDSSCDGTEAVCTCGYDTIFSGSKGTCRKRPCWEKWNQVQECLVGFSEVTDPLLADLLKQSHVCRWAWQEYYDCLRSNSGRFTARLPAADVDAAAMTAVALACLLCVCMCILAGLVVKLMRDQRERERAQATRGNADEESKQQGFFGGLFGSSQPAPVPPPQPEPEPQQAGAFDWLFGKSTQTSAPPPANNNAPERASRKSNGSKPVAVNSRAK